MGGWPLIWQERSAGLFGAPGLVHCWEFIVSGIAGICRSIGGRTSRPFLADVDVFDLTRA